MSLTLIEVKRVILFLHLLLKKFLVLISSYLLLTNLSVKINKIKAEMSSPQTLTNTQHTHT